MAEDFSKLSPGQLKKLAAVIQEAKGLTSRQAEIIEEVIKGETDIGELRITYLEEYFDVYSKNLDIIARKHSQLNDAFLILERRLVQQRKDIASMDSGDEPASKKSSSGSAGSGGSEPTGGSKSSGVVSIIDQLTDACKKRAGELSTVIEETAVAIERAVGDSRKRLLEQHKKATAEHRKLESSISALELLRHDTEKRHLAHSIENNAKYIRETTSAAKTTDGLITSIVENAGGAAYRVADTLSSVDSGDVGGAQLETLTALASILSNLAQMNAEDGGDNSGEQPAGWLAQFDGATKSLTSIVGLLTEYQGSSGGDSGGGASGGGTTGGQSGSGQSGDDGSVKTETHAKDSARSQLDDIGLAPTLPFDFLKQLIGTNRDDHDNIIHDQIAAEKAQSKDNTSATQMALLAAGEEELGKIRSANAEKQRSIEEALTRVELARRNTEFNMAELQAKKAEEGAKLTEEENQALELLEERTRALSLAATEAFADAADKAARLRESFQAEIALAMRSDVDEQGNPTSSDGAAEMARVEFDTRRATAEAEFYEQLAKDKAAWEAAEESRVMKELEARARESGQQLSEEEYQRELANIKRRSAVEFKDKKFTTERLFEMERERRKKDEEEKRKEAEKKAKEKEEAKEKHVSEQRNKLTAAVNGDGLEDNSLLGRFKAVKEVWEDEETGEKGLKKAAAMAGAIATDVLKKLESSIEAIAAKKGLVDTRLHGSKMDTTFGSYWDKIVHDITAVGAVNPYFKQEDFAKNIEDLVAKGIAFDVEQRAFLLTIKDKIATTFDVADGTLLRLIRLQQADSSAGRLGMEAALNAFLNEMYETTEYLTDVASGIRGSLEEMQALMEGDAAVEVEYQVQKWLGSLYSVGMSKTAVEGIAGALGKIAAGDIDGLTNNGAGNLLVMAANDAGLSIADILVKGINASDTNKLLQATVNYLASIAKTSEDNKVVQQQLANVFGVQASDIRAAVNLSTNTGDVYSETLSYDNMISTLEKMASTMALRTSMGEMMTNVWTNGSYTIAGAMASNPIAYITYKLAGLLDATTGGFLPLPHLTGFGTGIDLHTSVSDLMRAGAIGAGIIGSLGSIISGLSNSFDGKKMLTQMGITSEGGLQVVERGGGGGVGALASGGQQSTSSSGYAGNSNGNDVANSTQQSAEDDGKKKVVEAMEEREEDRVDLINVNVLRIYKLLYDVVNGKDALRVKIDSYGLTGLNNLKFGAMGGLGGAESSASGSVGGGGLSSSSDGSSGGAGGSSFGGGAGGSSGTGGSGVSGDGGAGGTMTLGGWTTML